MVASPQRHAEARRAGFGVVERDDARATVEGAVDARPRRRTRSARRLGRIRHRVYEVLEQARPGDATARRIHLFLVVTILSSVAAVVLESVPDYAARAGAFFIAVEVASAFAAVGRPVIRPGPEANRRPG